MEVSDEFHIPAALRPGKWSQYELDERLGDPRASLEVVE
jgi:hypothetical protein